MPVNSNHVPELHCLTCSCSVVTATSADVSCEWRSIHHADAHLLTLQGRHNQLCREIRQAKRRRNELLPILRLPAEILVHIFKLAKREPYEHPDYWLMKFSKVCQTWGTIADTTPSLWNSIGFGWDDLDDILERSGTAPLHLQAHLRKGTETMPQSGSRIPELLHRIKEIDLLMSTCCLRQVDLSGPAPLLEAIRLEADKYEEFNSQRTPDVGEFLPSNAPKLASIELYSFPLFRPLWKLMSPSSHIRQLIIDSYGERLYVRAILDTLRSLSCLARLNIEGDFVPLEPEEVADSASISLPQLRYLELDGSYKGCTELLLRLSLPPSASLHIIGNDHYFSSLRNHVSDYSEMHGLIIAVLKHSSSVSLFIGEWIVVESRDFRTGPRSVYCSGEVQPHSFLLSHDFSFTSQLAVTHLELSVAIPFDFDGLWQNFCTMASVESIKFGSTALHIHFLSLLRCLMDRPDSFPALETISIEEVETEYIVDEYDDDKLNKSRFRTLASYFGGIDSQTLRRFRAALLARSRAENGNFTEIQLKGPLPGAVDLRRWKEELPFLTWDCTPKSQGLEDAAQSEVTDDEDESACESEIESDSSEWTSSGEDDRLSVDYHQVNGEDWTDSDGETWNGATKEVEPESDHGSLLA